jgi:hypothetical protein
MDTQYRCNNKGRRQAVASQKTPVINGIDYLEVEVDGEKGKSTLKIHFIFNLGVPSTGKDLTKNNVVIEGGVRVRGVEVESSEVVKTTSNIFTVTVNTLGDFSTYTLRLTKSKIDLSPPDGFDPQLSHVDFSFKVKCPSEFDCKPGRECPPEKLPEPEIDYLAKDYASFRRLMLDRLSIIMPDWKERNPADLQVALVEMLAYVGDNLSYFQDAVATEAYLGTARKRISIRRHARLLDYFMHDGCNARAWVCLEVDKGSLTDGSILPGGMLLLTRGSDNAAVVDPDDIESFLTGEVTMFETMHPVTLYSAHSRIRFYTWSDTACCLPRGSTHATLLDEDDLSLNAGDVLIFEEVYSPTTGKEEDADPSHRHAVRLTGVTKTNDPLDSTSVVDIEWDEEDALPFPLCISALIEGNSGAQVVLDIAVARGNVVLADHGHTITEALKPEVVPEDGPYRPRLLEGPLTYRELFSPEIDLKKPAVSAMYRDVREALPAIGLISKDPDSEEMEWSPQYDLLASDRFAEEFVVENELDGISYLRFGEDVMGKRPLEGSTFKATYRIGNGRAGNIGAEAISRIVMKGGGVKRVRNPLPASGGTEPEPVEQVRLFAPQAFRNQERAVTEADYEKIAQKHPGVQKAIATIRWTGSWYTVFVTIDRTGGRDVDTDFKDKILAFLERYRIAGYDIDINGPVYVPLDITINVCVKPGYFRSNVKQSLLEIFSNHELVSGIRGFFHPDNFTFSQPVYLSHIYEVAMEVAGVTSVEVMRFQRWGKLPADEIETGILTPGTLEIIRLDNDPNFPENGKISFNMEGGL